MKLEVLISKKGSCERAYVSFPTTRKKIRETLSSVGILKDDWFISGVKTGSNHFGNLIISSKSLDELNLLGYWMSQFDDDQYHSFFNLCDVFKNDTNSVADCITRMPLAIAMTFTATDFCRPIELPLASATTLALEKKRKKSTPTYMMEYAQQIQKK